MEVAKRIEDCQKTDRVDFAQDRTGPGSAARLTNHNRARLTRQRGRPWKQGSVMHQHCSIPSFQTYQDVDDGESERAGMEHQLADGLNDKGTYTMVGAS